MPRPTIFPTMAEAVADVPDGVTILNPGFGSGMPLNLLTALYDQGAKDLTVVINGTVTASADPRVKNLGDLVEAGRVRKYISSFTAATRPSRLSKPEQMVRDGLLEVELVPQGTIAERIRAGGAGIPAFYTPAGVGTMVSDRKEHREFNGRTYVMEHAIFADYAFIRAWKADTAGNLVFRHGARNYNPIAAMAAHHTIVEVEHILEAGELSPDEIHTPGLYVERMVQIPPDGALYPARAATPAVTVDEGGDPPLEKRPLNRDEMSMLIGRRIPRGSVVNLGIGIPTLASNYVPADAGVTLTSENGVIGYGRLAEPGQGDREITNAGGQEVTLVPGASFVHHADSFALIRSGRVDVSVLGAYEVACDGSFANWRLNNLPWDNLGGIGGAMDLAACAKQIWIVMEHTAPDARPRLLERCTLPVTAPRGVTLVVTNLGVVAVRDGRFVLEEYAPGYTPQEIAELTGAPLDVSPTVREVSLA